MKGRYEGLKGKSKSMILNKLLPFDLWINHAFLVMATGISFMGETFLGKISEIDVI